MAKRIAKKEDVVRPQKSAELRLIEFVDNYVLDFNATRAYGEVWGSTNDGTNRTESSKYLAKPDVQQYLRSVLKARQDALHLDTAYVVRKYTEIVEADYTQVMKVMTYNQIASLPAPVRKLIQGVKIKKNKFENEQENGRYNSRETEEYEVTFMSKDKAIEALGRFTGAFAKDNVKGVVDLGKMSYTDMILAMAEIPDDDE